MFITPDGLLQIDRGPSIRTVMQSEAAECGLACLAMVASAFGYEVTLAELRRRFSISSKGITLIAMLGIADAIGLTGRPVRLEITELARLKLPVVLHWNFDHFVVMERLRGNRMLIHDPARGARWIDRAEFDAAFTGVAVEFTVAPSFQRRSAPERVRLPDLVQRTRGLAPALIQMIVLAAVMQLFALTTPLLGQLVVDEAITKGDASLLGVLVVGMAFLLLVTTAVGLVQGLVGLYMGTQVSFQLRTNLLRHMLRLPVSWYEKRHVGDIMSRFSSLEPVQDFLLHGVPGAVLNLVIAAAALVMMCIYAPLLAALEVAGIVVSLVVRLAGFGHVRRLTDQGLHLGSKVDTLFLETIRGARTLKLFGKERERIAMWQNEQARFVNNRVALTKFGLLGNGGTTILLGLQQIAVWFLGARMVIDGTITLGMLFAFQAYAGQFGNAANGLVAFLFSIKTSRIHLERLADVIHTDEEAGLDDRFADRGEVTGRIELKDVGFRYADHEPFVVRSIDLSIRAGEFVCLQGPSGHGKSTILKLMLGFEEPQEGVVLIEGVPLRTFGASRYRSRIGAVLQDDQLFAGTIAENVCFFDVDPDQERIERAATAANIHREIVTLPMGYQTFTGDLGSTLSAGQRQRLLLARALYREPAILFLDEGTANLDPESERAVMEVVRALPITRITVAHRPGAASGATRIIRIADGTAAELQPA